MENLVIEGYQAEYFIPTVNFNAETGVCEISGESYLEETIQFYAPLTEWLEQYLNENNSIKFIFRLSYYNTSSSKRILDILRLLKNYQDKGCEVTVSWFFETSDVDAIEDVEDFMIVSKLKIDFVEYQ